MKQSRPEGFIMRASIYPGQYFTLLTMTTVCANPFIIPSAFLDAGGRAAWLLALFSWAAGAVLVLAAWGLARYFPNETLPEYLPRLVGRIPAAIISLLFALVLLINVAMDARTSMDAVAVGLFVYTPIPVTVALFVALSAYLAWTGHLRFARVAPLYFLVVSVTFVTVLLLTRRWMDPGFLRPWLDFTQWRPASLDFWVGIMALRPLALIVMFYPYVQKQRLILPLSLGAAAVAALILAVATLAPVAVLGLQGAQMTPRPFTYLMTTIFFADAPFESFDFFARLLFLNNSVITMAAMLWAAGRLLRLAVAPQVKDAWFIWGLAVLAWALQVPVVRAVPFRLLALWTVIIVYLAGLSLGLLIPLAAWQARRTGKARA